MVDINNLVSMWMLLFSRRRRSSTKIVETIHLHLFGRPTSDDCRLYQLFCGHNSSTSCTSSMMSDSSSLFNFRIIIWSLCGQIDFLVDISPFLYALKTKSSDNCSLLLIGENTVVVTELERIFTGNPKVNKKQCPYDIKHERNVRGGGRS